MGSERAIEKVCGDVGENLEKTVPIVFEILTS